MATPSRALAFSRQLAQAHNTLRTQLSQVRTSLGTPTSDLQTHCLAFCSALTAHHSGEDVGLFAELVRVRPDLQPVVDNLVQDHGLISNILTTVSRLAREASSATSPRRDAIGRELDGLAAIMESHFNYEERAIGAVLDTIEDTGWSAAVFHPE